MENVSLVTAKEIFGINFLGPDELSKIMSEISVLPLSSLNRSIPEIPFSLTELVKYSKTHILILVIPFDQNGDPLNLLSLRAFYGLDPSIKEPCFYNQDWYLKETFANSCKLEFKWYLLEKNLVDLSRGKAVESVDSICFDNLPSALLCAFVFFSYYYHSKEYLWESDYVWCSDMDSNGDRVYVGRYIDPQGINKNGFSIHRHLRIKNNYGIVRVL